jgi:hypothetical protein
VHTKHEFLPPEPFLRFSQRTSQTTNFRSKTHVWGGFAKFRCGTSLVPKTGDGVHTNTSFCNRNHFFIFHNEHAQSTTLGPKLMFGVVLLNFVAARHPFQKRVSGCIQTRVFATGTISSFFHNEHAQSTTLGPKLMFGGGFAQFRCRTSPITKTGVGVHTKHEFLPPEPFLRFSQRTCSNHYFMSRTHVCVVSRNFVVARHPFRKLVSGCIRSTSFCHRNHFFVFRNEHAQSTTLGPKLMFRVVLRNFVAARHPFQKRVSGCI